MNPKPGKSQPKPGAAPTPAPAATPPRRRRLRRWLVVLAVVLLVLRAALGLALPPLARSLAADQGWDLAWQRLDLSLLALDVELAHVDLTPSTGEGPELHLEYARADVSVWHLLTGELVVPRVEVDGLDLAVTRGPDGELVLPTPPPSEDDGAAADEEPSDDDAEEREDEADEVPADDGPVDLSPPLRLDALRLQHVQLTYTDRSVDPPLETRVDLDVRGSDLGAADRQARLSVGLAASGLLDRLWLELAADSTAELLDARLDLRLGGLDLRPARDLLAPLGLEPREVPITLDLAGAARAESGEQGLGWSARLDQLALAAGGRPAVTLERLSVEAAPGKGPDLTLSDVLVQGLLARAVVEPDGTLAVPGLAFVAGAPPAEDEPAEEPEPAEQGAAGGLVLDRLRLVDQRVELDDRSVSPATTLELVLRDLTVTHVSTLDTRPSTFTLDAVVPDVLDQLALSGQVTPAEGGGSLTLDLAVEGLEPVRLEPHLERAGLRSLLDDARLTSAVEGRWCRTDGGDLVLDGTLTGLALEDPAGTTRLGDVTVEGLTVPADEGPLRLARLGLTGLGAVVTLHEDGRVSLPGLEVLPAPAAVAAAEEVVEAVAEAALDQPAPPRDDPAAAPAPASADPAMAAPAGPALVVDRIAVADNRLRVVLPDGQALQIADWDLGVADLRAGGGPATTSDLRLTLSIPQVVRQLVLEGGLGAEGADQTLDLSLRAEGLSGQISASLLGPAARPALDDGRLGLDVSARVGADGRLDAELSGLALEDGGREWLGLDRLAVVGLRPGETTTLEALELEGPRLAVVRRADGSLRLPAVELPPPAPADGEPAPAPPAAPPAAPAPAAPASSSGGFILDRLVLDGGRVAWRDEALAAPLDQDLTFGVQLDGLDLAAGAPPAELALRLGLPGALEELTLAGTVLPSPATPEVALALRGRGLTWTSLLPYLPAGSTSQLSDGRLALDLSAALAPAEAGGQAVTVTLADLSLRDGADGEALLGLERLALDAPRLDPAAPSWHVAELVLEGLQARAGQDERGGLSALGLQLPPPPEPAEDLAGGPAGAEGAAGNTAAGSAAGSTPGPSVAASQPTTVETAAQPAAAGAAAQPAAAQPTATAQSAAGSTAGEPQAGSTAATAAVPSNLVASTLVVPSLRLDRLDVGLEQLTWQVAGAEPLAVRGLRLVNEGPVLLEPDSDEEPLPFVLRLDGAVPPLVDDLELVLDLAPFAVEPTLAARLDVTGVHGDRLAAVLPATAEGLDASDLTDGRLHLELEGSWLGRRRHALDFSTSGGLSGELLLEHLALRDGADGEVLVGLEELRLDIQKALGRSGDLRLGSLEIVGPTARVEQLPEGLRVADVVLLAPPAPEPVEGAEEDGADESVEPVEPGAPAGDEPVVAEAPEPAPPAEPGPVQALETLIVSGADVVFTDRTVDPPLVFPIVGLDAEVKGLTNRALTEKRRIDYVLMMQGGVPAERPAERPERPALDELEIGGWIVPWPTPVGRTQIDLRAFDLLTVQGHAAAADVALSDGLFDASVQLEFEEDGDLDTSSRFFLTDLDVSEPADGPISRFLRLPAPLNVVIGALRKDGVLEIPLDIEVPSDGLSVASLVTTGLETLGVLIATAIANAPLRVVGGVTEGVGSLVGLGGEDELVAGDPQELPFVAGTSGLTDEALAILDGFVERLDDEDGLLLTLSHQVGAEDVRRLGERANPPAAWAIDLAGRLRFHMAGLVRERQALAVRLRGLLSAGLDEEAELATAELVDLDERIGAAARAVDHLYEVVRPGAERLAARRTREMCLAMAEVRLAEVAAALRARLDEEDQGRVRLLPPRFTGETDRERSTVTVTPSISRIDS